VGEREREKHRERERERKKERERERKKERERERRRERERETKESPRTAATQLAGCPRVHARPGQLV